jgi:hypothetical protein
MTELKERNEAVVKEIFDLLNKMTNEKDLLTEFVKHLDREHRTLQQNFLGMLRLIILEYSENTGMDARNEASKKWAKKVAEMDDGYHFPFI